MDHQQPLAVWHPKRGIDQANLRADGFLFAGLDVNSYKRGHGRAYDRHHGYPSAIRRPGRRSIEETGIFARGQAMLAGAIGVGNHQPAQA